MEAKLACTICNEEFSENLAIPYMLVCGHTFCSNCILKLSRLCIIRCPLCSRAICQKDCRKNYIVLELIKSPSSKLENQITISQDRIEAMKQETQSHKACLMSVHSYIIDTQNAITSFCDKLRSELVTELEAQKEFLEDMLSSVNEYLDSNLAISHWLENERLNIEGLVKDCSKNEQVLDSSNILTAQNALIYLKLRELPEFKFGTTKLKSMKSRMQKLMRNLKLCIEKFESTKVEFNLQAKAYTNKYELNFNGLKIPYDIKDGFLYLRSNLNYNAKLEYFSDSQPNKPSLKRSGDPIKAEQPIKKPCE